MSGDIIHSSRTDIYPARSSHVVDPIFVLDGENTNTVQGPLGPHNGSVANDGAHPQEIYTGSLTPFASVDHFLCGIGNRPSENQSRSYDVVPRERRDLRRCSY